MKHKNHKKYRARLLTAVFAAVMVMSLMPLTASARETPADNRVGKRKRAYRA